MQTHAEPPHPEFRLESGAPTGPLVVGIGGSAGALPALIALLESLGEETRLAIVVVLHLSPDHESHSVEILQRSTPMVVQQVTQRTKLEKGHVYVIAPGTKLITDDGHIQPGEASLKRPSSVIDLFFRTLGQVHRENAIGVILSGTGRDGSLGLMQIKECGGLTMGQAIEDCEHPDMPRAAEASGGVDLMLSAAEIGQRLAVLARSPFPLSLTQQVPTERAGAENTASSDPEDAERAFHDILTALRLRTRHDFRHYKRATLLRRLERRIQVNGLSTIPAYRDFVREHPEELNPLLADMLISVTNFFRDPQAFEVLQRDVLPQILESTPVGDEARVWIPACASGEESYSVAIALQEIADRLAAQETIVNDLLDLSRVQTGKLHIRHEPTDLSDMVQRFSEAMAADAARKQIQLTIDLPREALICACDPVRIEQVIWNLLGNAIKFTPDGGEVHVSLRNENGEARLDVVDSGIGISAEFLPNVFELFNQGDATSVPGQKRPGLGIGLALVRELVHAHEGRIVAESQGKGHGSTFTVWLPLRAASLVDATDSHPKRPLECHILMVDDDVDALATLAALMEMEGAVVETAGSGAEALKLLTTGAYDVLVSDIGMPHMSGHELMRQARKLRPGKKFRSVALTGFGSDADERDALEAGFDAFLTKPISVERLRTTLEELCRKR